MTSKTATAKSDKLKYDVVVEDSSSVYSVQYNSIMSFIDAMRDYRIDESKVGSIFGCAQTSVSQDCYFANLKTGMFDEALEMLSNGWQDGIEQASKIVDSLLPEMESKLRDKQLCYNDESGVLDIQAFLNGESEYFMNMAEMQTMNEKSRQDKGKLKVVVNTGARGGVDSSAFLYKGIVVFCVVQMLELDGYAIELWLENRGDFSTGRDAEVLIKFKSMGEILDLARLICCIAHISFHRKIIFRYREAMRIDGNITTGNIGYSINGRLQADSDIYFPYLGVVNPYTSIDAAKKEVMRIVREYADIDSL